MRIVSWNIRQGASKRIPEVIRSIDQWAPDIVLLQECRASSFSDLHQTLNSHFSTAVLAAPVLDPHHNQIAVVSNQPLLVDPIGEHGRIQIIRGSRFVYDILSVHIPNPGDRVQPGQVWSEIESHSSLSVGRASFIAGDFNTCLPSDGTGGALKNRARLRRLLDLGWVDAWRYFNQDKSEYTFQNPTHKTEFRIDYFFASPSALDLVKSCRLDHTVRLEGVSDHSAFILDLR